MSDSDQERPDIGSDPERPLQIPAELPVLPLRFAVTTYEVQPYVKGLTVTPSDSQLPGDMFYETIQIEKH